MTISLTPTIHIDQQSTSSLIRQTIIFSSSICLFHISSLSLSSFDFQSVTVMPSQDVTILSPLHMTIPTNTVCHSIAIYCFIQTQHQHEVVSSFCIYELHSTHCSHIGFLSFVLSFQLCFANFASQSPHPGSLMDIHGSLGDMQGSFMEIQ